MANVAVFGGSKYFRDKKEKTRNEAGGVAYKMTDKAALAQLCVTGCFNGTFYVSAKTQLDQMSELCAKVPAEYIAKLALYARRKVYMKDTPAFLMAYLVTRDPGLARKIFHKVIDNGKMLRNFVQIMRSGAVGRKCLGTSAKKMVNKWLHGRTDDQIFRDSVGNSPSLMDCVRMSHNAPQTKTRDALYGYLLGWEYSKKNLPQLVKDFEKFKKGKVDEVPDVPFQMLTSLELEQAHWLQIAMNARWHMTRMNLNTFQRHMVFEDKNMVKMVADRLRDQKEIKYARAFPYQLMAAYMNIGEDIPRKIADSLHDAMEVAVENIPRIDGNVYVCPDCSGSMHQSVTGYRKGSSSKVECVDVAALVAAAFLRVNKDTMVIPFESRVHLMKPRPSARDTVVSTADRIRKMPSGGTCVSAPLEYIHKHGLPVDLVVIVSDNESWVDSKRYGSTETLRMWSKIKQNNKGAKLVCIDVQPNTTTQAHDRGDVLNVGGFSDQVFEIIAMFSKHGLDADRWTGIIEAEEL